MPATRCFLTKPPTLGGHYGHGGGGGLRASRRGCADSISRSACAVARHCGWNWTERGGEAQRLTANGQKNAASVVKLTHENTEPERGIRRASPDRNAGLCGRERRPAAVRTVRGGAWERRPRARRYARPRRWSAAPYFSRCATARRVGGRRTRRGIVGDARTGRFAPLDGTGTGVRQRGRAPWRPDAARLPS